MSYYWFNGEKALKKTRDKYHSKRGRKMLLGVILLIEKF